MIDERLAPYGALALRVALGVMFIAHAYLKLAVFGIDGFAGFLGQVGLPLDPRLADHSCRVDRRYRDPRGLLWTPRLVRAPARASRRARRPRPERMAVQRAKRRLGISRLSRSGCARAGPDRRRRLGGEDFRDPGNWPPHLRKSLKPKPIPLKKRLRRRSPEASSFMAQKTRRKRRAFTACTGRHSPR